MGTRMVFWECVSKTFGIHTIYENDVEKPQSIPMVLKICYGLEAYNLTQNPTHPYEKIGSGEGRYPYENMWFWRWSCFFLWKADEIPMRYACGFKSSQKHMIASENILFYFWRIFRGGVEF